jgi:glycosyltransferase involved in cell wall biosynthesis
VNEVYLKDKRVRVLHLITRLIIGGAQENTMYTAALLNKDRYDVRIVSGPQTGSEGSLIEEVISREIPLVILPELGREINPLKDFLAFFKLYRLFQNQSPTIVHTHSSKAGILGRLAAKLAGVPLVVHTVHGWSFHPYMQPWLSRVYILLEWITAKFSDQLIVVAEKDKEKGLQAGIGKPEQYSLVRSAVPLAEFNPALIHGEKIRQQLGIPTGAPVLGNVGRFSPQKNPLDWMRVAALVGKALPTCRFLLVGDGPLRVEVVRLAETAGILDRCLFTGLRRDVPQMMAAMDVFLLTSLWEGLPRVIPQAMRMGLPVVANQVDGVLEAVVHGETGYLSPPGKIDEMAEFCVQLLRDGVLREKMGQSAQSRVMDTFDLEIMIERIENSYQALLSKKGLQG